MRYASASPNFKASPKSHRTLARIASSRMPRPAVLGNQAMLRRLQAKLTIGGVNDPLEREADAVAEHVMRMPDHATVSSASPPRISRKCASCETEDKKLLQMKRVPAAPAPDDAPPIVYEAMRSPGKPLDAQTRDFFEPRFGHDFSGVRVHSDDISASAARALQSRAYTFGSDITFGPGEYAPTSHEGQRLLAHELAHVVQQDAGIGASRPVAPATQILESRAIGKPTGNAFTPTRRLQRQSDTAQTASGTTTTAGLSGTTNSDDHSDAQPMARGDMDLSCHYRMGCPISVPCEGKTCGIASCGTGSCKSPLCPPDLINIVVKAWCQYDCIPSGAAFLLITPFGGYTLGPYCIDGGKSSSPKTGAMPGNGGVIAGSGPPAANSGAASEGEGTAQ
jgi:hypothetical protein